jgi:beta-N-acetylhexosaminidase
MVKSLAPTALKELGNLFMVGLPGLTLDDSTKRLIKEYQVNNFIFFKRNVESPEQLKKLSGDIRDVCSKHGLAPPLISIDQEGGTVARLEPPFTQFPDARKLAESEQPEKAFTDYALTCSKELLGVGVNMNLAPVLDVCETGQGFFMERRALGRTPEEVGRLGNIIIKTMQDNGLAACAKHFPGLGSAKVDPHFKLPQVSRTKAAMLTVDIPPFQQAISANVAAIMTSHTIYNDLDTDNPATLSATILTGLLRNQLGYNGVIITDDLEMGAIENEGTIDQAALQALEAGADILLVCHSHDKVVAAIKKISEAARNVPVLQERINESGLRVNLLRQQFAKQG